MLTALSLSLPLLLAAAAPSDCSPGAGITLWHFPEAPIAGAPLRLLAVLDDARALGRGPDDPRLRVTPGRGKPLRLETVRRSGPPTSFFAEVPATTAGPLRIELLSGTDIRACTSIEVAPRGTARPKRPVPTGFWPTTRAWDRSTEGLYAAWVEALFDAPVATALAFPSLAPVIRDPARNFLHNHLGLAEDAGKGKDALPAEPDCADLPYYLRAYFAWKLGLPMGLRDCSRGTATSAPRCGPVFTNEEKPPKTATSYVGAFKQFLRKLANTAHSGSARTALGDEDTDLYPVALDRAALRPGTVFADPYGHVLLLAKWVPQGRDTGGLLLAVDGQPDNSITRKRFWEGTFLFASGEKSAGPGWKAFRPLVRDGAEAPLRALSNAALTKDERFAPMSQAQATLGRDDFYADMAKLINPRGLDAQAAYQETLAALVEQVGTRVTSVANGETYMNGPGKGTVVAMPEGAKIFETVGPWEDFATPSRDMRLLIAMKALLALPERIVTRPDLFVLGGKKPAAVRAEIEALHDRLTRAEGADPTRSIEYRKSDGTPQRLTVAELLARRAGFEVAYNPNDCVERRWAAPEGSPELATCQRRAPEDQRARMEQIRAWFRDTRRPPR